ncbi:hypothetical protein, partial [Tropicibacter naphthalenivorans]
AHNLKVVGSNPTPATKFIALATRGGFFVSVRQTHLRQSKQLNAKHANLNAQERFTFLGAT